MKVLSKLTMYGTLMIEGTIAIAFGIMAPVLIGAVGMAMDLSQSYLVRQRLHGALDASALSAAATLTEDDEEIRQRVIDFLEANYPAQSIGFLDMDAVEIDVSQSEVTVTAVAQYPTTFMRVLGIESLTVASTTTVAREIKGLEVVLVLDNTGSMGASNMASLRTATTNFVNILFSKVEDPEDLRIGLVPYSSSVRVGPYGLGQFPDGTPGYGDPFVELPAGITYGTSRGGDNTWYGCVVEYHENNYHIPPTESDPPAKHVTNSRGQLWSTNTEGTSNEFKCNNASSGSGSKCRAHGWNPATSSNDPYPNDTRDEYTGPWDIYMYGKIVSRNNTCSGSDYGSTRCSSCPSSNDYECNQDYCFCGHTTPATSCPYAMVVPLTSDQQELLDAIPTMQHEGSTYSNLGMAWGMRILSPEAPFTEGSEWGDEEWNKAVVMMTDGEMSPSSVYSGYWAANKTSADSIATLNSRLTEVCNLLKARDVIIYTITFDHATSDISESTKNIYRNCATSSAHYFDAPTQENLISVFERISGALANLHIRR
ncbi:MAG: VWA domain-containing protein [Micavibrio sp.]